MSVMVIVYTPIRKLISVKSLKLLLDLNLFIAGERVATMDLYSLIYENKKVHHKKDHKNITC